VKPVDELQLEETQAESKPSVSTPIALEIRKLDIKEYRTTAKENANFRCGLYNTVIVKCTEALEGRLKLHKYFASSNQDVVKLLVILNQVLYAFEEKRHLLDSLAEAKESYTPSDKGSS
jgi:hypothetical protein